MNSEVRSQIVANALRADSLQAALERQSRYMMNIQDIFSGKVNADTVQSIDSLTDLRTEKLMKRSKKEEEFRQQYEEKERAVTVTAVTDDRYFARFVILPSYSWNGGEGFCAFASSLWGGYGSLC